MAEEAEGIEGGGGDDGGGGAAKCPPCAPGLPGWMATFSDLVTLLLTFFVLLLSFAKTESAKYEAALGSIRNAFGGNVMKQGEVIQRGKSPDDSPTMIDSQEPIRPFPIEFLTTEGFLDKLEINRESAEDLQLMREDLKEYDLSENADIYEMSEGIKVEIKDKIFFKEGSIVPDKISIPVYDRIVQMLSQEDWTIFVVGHASVGETSNNGMDAFDLSAARSAAVARSLIKRGVRADKVTTAFHGDSKAVEIPGKSAQVNAEQSRRVEFILRKTDLETKGKKVRSQ